MSNHRLEAIVIGAGWAGEGHTLALRHNGVHVQAICARDRETVEAVAQRLEVPEASTDWRATLQAVQPDIVSIATPASLRREVVEVAADRGCHILCDKPLAPTGPEAKALFESVDHAGVKHAYAATRRYDPHVAWTSELVQEGAIGELYEIDVIERWAQPYPAMLPWGWWFSLAAGGGLLNTATTHVLGMLERVIGGPIVRATGETRRVRERAFVTSGIHDSRQLFAEPPSVTDPATLAWQEVDTEDAGSMTLAFNAPQQEEGNVLARDVFNTLVTAVSPPGGWYLYGTEGTLTVRWGQPAGERVALQSQPGAAPEAMPVPERLIEAHPQMEGLLGPGQIGNPYTWWAALVREFVADIQGRPYEPYLTFHDGWRYQEVIDAVRAGEGWRAIPPRL